MEKRLGKPEGDLSEERLARGQERSKTERSGRWNQALAYHQQQPALARQTIAGTLQDLNQRIQEAAADLGKDALEGREIDPKRLSFDPAGWADLLLPVIAQAQEAERFLVREATHSILSDALEGLVSHRHLTADERKEYQAAMAVGDYTKALRLHDPAGIRAAPAEAAKKAKDEATKDAGLLEKLLKAQAMMPRNGKRSLTGGGGADVSNIRTMADADAAYSEDRISHDQYKAIRERLMKAI